MVSDDDYSTHERKRNVLEELIDPFNKSKRTPTRRRRTKNDKLDLILKMMVYMKTEQEDIKEEVKKYTPSRCNSMRKF